MQDEWLGLRLRGIRGGRVGVGKFGWFRRVGDGGCWFLVGVEGDGDGGSETGVSGRRFACRVSTDFLFGLEESVEIFRRLLKKEEKMSIDISRKMRRKLHSDDTHLGKINTQSTRPNTSNQQIKNLQHERIPTVEHRICILIRSEHQQQLQEMCLLQLSY